VGLPWVELVPWPLILDWELMWFGVLSASELPLPLLCDVVAGDALAGPSLWAAAAGDAEGLLALLGAATGAGLGELVPALAAPMPVVEAEPIGAVLGALIPAPPCDGAAWLAPPVCALATAPPSSRNETVRAIFEQDVALM
jgi:hypothetical protein